MNFDDNLDLNIHNYNTEDLESFLNLKEGYTEDDVDKKTSEFSSKISNVNDKKLKDKLSEFVKKARTILTTNKKQNRLTDAGDTFIIKEGKYPVTNYVQQVYQTDIAKGDITRLKKKTTTTTFCLNTLFRDSNSNSATDCIYSLPYQIRDVVSIDLRSMELPQSIFLFSNSNNSNTIYFKEYMGNEGLVVFPEGNYPNVEGNKLEAVDTMMTTAINQALNSGTRFTVTLNPANNQINISNSTYNFDMYILYPGTNSNLSLTMGWILGFRKVAYKGQMSYNTESIYNVNPAEYLYLELNDYNVPQAASKVIGLFAESYLDKNILAKVLYPYKQDYTSYYVVTYNKSHLIGGLRDYFGPTNLQRFGIRLLNKYGEVVNLNGLSFSFTLELTVLYES